MNNWIQAVLERGSFRRRRRRFPATSIPMLLMLGVVLLWPSVSAQGQFALNQIANTNVPVNRVLQIQTSVTDSNIPRSQLNFSLTSAPPNTDATNASITVDTGVFTWVPAITQTVTFTVSATNRGAVNQGASTNFIVTVTNTAIPVNPPSLTLPFSSPTNITVGMTLTFTAIAATTDGSSNPLTFRLADTNGLAIGVPPGARIDPTPGGFPWTPADYQANGEYPMEVIVTEANTNTSLSATQAFTVGIPPLVNDCAQYSNVLWTVANGGPPLLLDNCPTLVLPTTLVVTADNVTLTAGTNGATISGNNLVRLFTVMPGASLTLNGLTLLGGQSDNGGAIYIMAGGAVILNNCVFAGNSAAGASGSNGVDGNSDPNYG